MSVFVALREESITKEKVWMRRQGGAEDVERKKGRRVLCLNLDVLGCQKNTSRLEQNHSVEHPSYSSNVHNNAPFWIYDNFLSCAGNRFLN